MDRSRNPALRAALCVAALLLAVATQAQEAAIPPLAARVTDTAALLSPDQRATLETNLADHEARKGTQIAVLTVSSTAPETIEQYGIRVADAWKIGRKGTGDGVIVIVAKDNPPDLNRLRIEVGRGLEGAIPDAEAKRIIDESIAPHFRLGDYDGGLLAAVTRIESLADGEALPEPAAPAPVRSTGFHPSGFVIFILLFFVVPVVIPFLFGRKMTYAAGNRGSGGSFGAFVAGQVIGSLIGSAGRGGGGSFGSGGGGGFSGGGGDFGGGGASGNW